MRKSLMFSVLLLGVVLFSCKKSDSPQDKALEGYGKVDTGMTPEAVKELMGPPSEIHEQMLVPPSEIHNYPAGSAPKEIDERWESSVKGSDGKPETLEVTFKDGKVARKKKY